MTHELKTWPQYFCRVKDGTKTFEVRNNDRGFQPNDNVILREWDPTDTRHDDEAGPYHAPKGYSGQKLEFKVGYVYPLDESRVVFALLKKD